MAKLWPCEARAPKWRWPILGHKMAIFGHIFWDMNFKFVLPIITALASATGESGGEAPRLHRTGGEAPCSIEGRKTRREENVFKGVENLPALLYTIV